MPGPACSSVIRESGGDRTAVTGGTIVLSDRIVVRVTSNPGETFLDRMIALVEGASRQKTPNEVALDILIAGLTLILLVAVVTLQPMAVYDHAIQSTAVLVALFVCLAPTTIGGLADETPEGRSIVDLAESRYPLVPPDWGEEAGGEASADLTPVVERIASGGGTPLVVLSQAAGAERDAPGQPAHRDPAPQWLDLRGGRDHRPVRLDQGF